MPRSLTSGINSALTAQGSRPGYIVQIALNAGGSTLRLSNIGAFTFASQSWTSADFELEGLQWDGSAARDMRIAFGDTDLVFWTYALAGQFADALIWAWQVYASAPNEAEPVFYGRCGRATRQGLLMLVECHNAATLAKSPRVLLQYVVNPVFLLPSGSVIQVGSEQVTLERR